MRFLKDVKEKIYEPIEVVGTFHMLALQLVAAGIVELAVAPDPKSNVGADKFSSSNVVIKLSVTDANMPTFMSKESW